MLAFNPGGREELSGDSSDTTKRDEGYLYWLAWGSHLGNSIFSSGDAQGPWRRVLLALSCASYRDLVNHEPAVAPLLGITDLLTDPTLCPQ
jgi:hypothetical protein